MMRMERDATSYESAAAEVKDADKMMVKRVFGGELDMDQESTGSSSEEMESPRSVVKVMRRWSNNSKEKNMAGIGMCVHSQILRIRYEDSHIGDDISTEVLNLFDKDDKQSHLPSLVVFSKPILPASPLGGKTIIKTSD